jgi:hypothetical protein
MAEVGDKFNENGPPHLRFWFCPESTLPDQFFKPDPPVVRTAKIFVDFDSTFYTMMTSFDTNEYV